MKVCFCTSNEGKFVEAEKVLSAYEIALYQDDVPLLEPKTSSIEEVALSKARQAFLITDKPVLVEDTGLFFLDYKDFPGAFTNVFVTGVGLEGVLRLVEGTSRKAEFRTTVCFKDAYVEKTFSNKVSGTISKELRGVAHDKLPFDLVFIPDGWSKTFGEGTLEEKNSASNRAKVFSAFGEWFKQYSSEEK